LNIQSYLNKQSRKINKALSIYLPKPSSPLHEAVRYAVLSGGKRIRPVLTLAACEAVGGDPKKAMPAACAVEFIHSYSLIHDDLPCMDNDDLRRGKPTCHKKFGEDTALLAGDALLTLAFKVLSSHNGHHSPADFKRRLEVVSWVAQAAGVYGMVGGQAVDMEYQKKEMDLPTMEYIHTHKTGALIAVSLKSGALLGGGTPDQTQALYNYGKTLGLLFQIVDDILDKEGYAKMVGIARARKTAEGLVGKAKRKLNNFGKKASALKAIADFVFTREH